ncbi:MAG: hypothetical protein GY795_42885 [Desulfobacterales bacterium]|nr:hypothetical protein [Desulfobacterales bacterium]
MTANPKTHDSLFKWLITSFTKDFFAHYYPKIRIGKYSFFDKEFIRKYEALKESLRGDLFLVMEVEIDGQVQEIVIQIEHKSEKKDVGRQVYEYSCYAWLLKEKPVWSIVIYTDEAVWRKQVPDSFWYAFDSRNKKQFYHYDVIKVKAEKSSDLIKKHSMLCKLLALKANDRKTDPEELVYEIYHAASEMRDILANEQLLLIGQWVSTYKKVTDQTLDRIKKEVKMDCIETTITEHIFNQGKTEGETEGEIKGEIKGQIKTLENLYSQGILLKEMFEEMVTPLRRKLNDLLSEQQ